MSLTKEDISNLIQHTDKAEAFDSVMRRNIPYEPYQLAMMFMNGRRIGKSFMAYGLVAESCLELLVGANTIFIFPDYASTEGYSNALKVIIRGYDSDVIGQQRFNDWINRFKDFLGEYYPELRVDMQSGNYIVRKVEDVETE